MVTPRSTSTPQAATRPLRVAFIGNPNTGKSTVFNALAGLNSRVGNFPGCTVEKKVGKVVWDNRRMELIDLPGTYSLSPRSLDEMVSVEVLLGRQKDVGSIDAVVCVVDASNLERNLFLASQVLDLGLPTVLVLNMMDVAQSRQYEIDVPLLSRKLGIPVVTTEAHRRRGLTELKQAIVDQVDSSVAPPPRLFPAEFYAACDHLEGRLPELTEKTLPRFMIERMLIDVGGEIEAELARDDPQHFPQVLTETRSALREQGVRVPAIESRVRYAWAGEIVRDVIRRPSEHAVTASDRIDHILTHRVMGLAVFASLMFVVFMTIFAWAEPLMALIESVQELSAGYIAAAMPPGSLRSLLIDGVITGVGGVLVFLPQIAFLFFFIAILEDCGYMARAAFLMDRLMTRIGLSGKSFVPLMSSFACAIPGVMSTRVIENRKDRMVTILVAPLMSCSARLPVYTLLIALFIPEGNPVRRGAVLFAMYSLGVLVAIPVAWILRRTFFRGETPPFVMELPSYKWPSPRIVLHRVYDRSLAFVLRAGTLIFATTVLVWAAGYFPGDHSEQHALQAEIEQLETVNADDPRLSELYAQQNNVSGRLISESLLGMMGHAVEPAVRPLGWDWKIGVGVIASFPAREVIVATLGTIYSLGGDIDEEDTSLRKSLSASKWPDGRPVYTVPTALSIMVFFALCAQCAATLVVIKRETNSWRWPVFTFAYMTLLAYCGAFLTYQIGTIFIQ